MTAVDAAVAVGRANGLDVTAPRVVRSVGSVLVHLAPAPVLARVPAGPTGAADRARLRSQLAMAGYLVESGVPVAGPAPGIDPGPHEHAGSLVTLWQYVDHDEGRALDARGAGGALRAMHEALAAYDDGTLDHFARLEEVATLAAGLDLSPDVRSDFDEAVAAAAARVAALPAPLQPIHGDAHLGNVLRTPDGPLWCDFDQLCRGPRELDLACNEVRAAALGRSPADDEFLAGYGDHDAGLVTELVPLLALVLAALTFQLARVRPEFTALAHERLALARSGLCR